MRILLLFVVLPLIGSCRTPDPSAANGETVILLHGLCRSPHSMRRMGRALQREGYQVENLSYPSRKKDLELLATEHLCPVIERVRAGQPKQIHFVTHSMGGILTRYWLSTHLLPELGKVVLLSPPNQGSEVVDRMGHWRSFQLVNGPASLQLHTGKDSLPNLLPAPDYPLAVFTGSRSINPFLSLMIPGKDDGKVSLERAKVPGMTRYQVFPVSHPFIMRDKDVIRATIDFLKTP